jgi:serine-type D-Ala-D-Ala carboxypeptidase (penicillin-binding protein 5/6)
MAGRRRASWVWIVFAVVIGAMVLTPATVAAVRIMAPPPAPSVSVHVPVTLLVDGKAPPPIPVPARGSFALATSLNGTVASRAATAVRPIGSVAKAMTALVVLGSHPLAVAGAGPSIVMTTQDEFLYRQAVAEGGSNLRVHAGEVLTERDLLLALMLPSADNIAETLAVWVSGNRSAFIARLNATAVAMGMHRTHFADPSGLSVRTVSTAQDLVLLARAVIANPALAGLVATVHAVLPDGTALSNLDILLVQAPGWLGIKTGWTGAAGGCLLFAARMSYDPGHAITLWGAILGQPPLSSGDPGHPELGQAFASARSAVAAAVGAYESVDLGALPIALSGSIATRWGPGSSLRIPEPSARLALVRAGEVLHLHTIVLSQHAPIALGATVAEITGVLDARTSITWEVVTTSAIAAPSPWWKLFSS